MFLKIQRKYFPKRSDLTSSVAARLLIQGSHEKNQTHSTPIYNQEIRYFDFSVADEENTG